jgi:hypothetical protein
MIQDGMSSCRVMMMTSEWITGLPPSDITQRLRSDTGETLAGEKALMLLRNRDQNMALPHAIVQEAHHAACMLTAFS